MNFAFALCEVNVVYRLNKSIRLHFADCDWLKRFGGGGNMNAAVV